MIVLYFLRINLETSDDESDDDHAEFSIMDLQHFIINNIPNEELLITLEELQDILKKSEIYIQEKKLLEIISQDTSTIEFDDIDNIIYMS